HRHFSAWPRRGKSEAPRPRLRRHLPFPCRAAVGLRPSSRRARPGAREAQGTGQGAARRHHRDGSERSEQKMLTQAIEEPPWEVIMLAYSLMNQGARKKVFPTTQ